MARVLQNILVLILDFLFPAGKYERLARTHPEDIVTRFSPRTLDTHPYVTACFSYGDPLIKNLIWALKYHRKREVAALFGTVMHDYILDMLGDEVYMTHFTDPILIPIPASEERIKEYGFNHAEEVARALSGKMLTVETNVLLKKRGSLRQVSKKNKVERLANIKNTFTVHNAEKIRGKNIILVDDVVTTGATLEEAKRMLTEAGTKEVRALVIAH